eukprot:gene631-1299_t
MLVGSSEITSRPARISFDSVEISATGRLELSIVWTVSCLTKVWDKWVGACLRLHYGLEIVFQKLAEAVTKRPRLTIAASILCVAVLATGLHKYEMEKRSDRLFIPQNSRSMKDLDKASQYFPFKTRISEIILTATDKGNVLTGKLFTKLLDLHNGIINLDGYNEMSLGQTLNILELFNFSKIVIDSNLTMRLNEVYRNSSYLMSNLKLASVNFPQIFGGLSFNSSGNITSATAVRVIYFMKYHTTDAIYEKAMAFEERYINYLKGQEQLLKSLGIELYFYAHRSLDDSISESALSDLKLIIVAFTLMISFCVIMNMKIRRPVNGHVILTLGGILTVFLGIGSAFGLVMYTSTPFIGIVGVLPFMVLGVGIDDMFILVDTLDQRETSLRGNVRLTATLSCAGSSILMTTLTDLIAFMISTSTDFKGIQYFCIYAALSITFVFILMVTFFLALMMFDVRRVEQCKRDIVPCYKEETKENPWHTEKSDFSTRIMFTLGKILMKNPVRIAVVTIGLALLAVSIYGTTYLDQSFDSSTLGKDNSYQKKFYDARRKYYSRAFEVSIVVIGEYDYSNAVVQAQYIKLSDKAISNPKYQNYRSNWLENYIHWSKQCCSRSIAGSNFTLNLHTFLGEPRYTQHKRNLKFAAGKIQASRIIVRSQSNDHSIFRKDAMISLRAEIDAECCLNAFPIALTFIYFEQFAIILRDTIRNLVSSGSAVLLVTLPYLIHPGVTLLVVTGFVSLIFELMAIMYLWNVSLNSISMIIIVMAIGFSVDYSAHIAHAYVVSTAEKPEDRVIDALKTMGASVAMGGFSTFLGMLVTAFASSEVFRIFFKMIFSIVVLGLLHGLIFLPVYLSLFCRTRIFLPNELKTTGSQRELTKSPENSQAVYHSPVHHGNSGREIGSKIIPVSPKKSSVDESNNNAAT